MRYFKYYIIYLLSLIIFGLTDTYMFHDKVDLINNKMTALAVMIAFGFADIRDELYKFQ